MMREACLALILSFTLCGCGVFSPSGGGVPGVESRMRRADSLERDGAYERAAAQYAAVAMRYPDSDYFATAVRKAALLYAISPSSAHNDSAAHRWFEAYLALPLKAPERENARAAFELLNRVVALHAQMARLYTASDSLAFLTRMQAGAVAAADHRKAELEDALQKAQAELKKIKETDIRLSNTKVR